MVLSGFSRIIKSSLTKKIALVSLFVVKRQMSVSNFEFRIQKTNGNLYATLGFLIGSQKANFKNFKNFVLAFKERMVLWVEF